MFLVTHKNCLGQKNMKWSICETNDFDSLNDKLAI